MKLIWTFVFFGIVTGAIGRVLDHSFHRGWILSTTRKPKPERVVCETQQCKELAKTLIESMNHTVDPCEDFYEYACGNWKKHNPLPEGVVRWNLLQKIQRKVVDRLKVIVKEGPQPDDIHGAKIAKRAFNTCMDTDAMDKEGLQPLISTLWRAGGWPMIMDEDEWDEYLYKWQNVDDYYALLIGENSLHSVHVDIDYWNDGGIYLFIKTPDTLASMYKILNTDDLGGDYYDEEEGSQEQGSEEREDIESIDSDDDYTVEEQEVRYKFQRRRISTKRILDRVMQRIKANRRTVKAKRQIDGTKKMKNRTKRSLINAGKPHNKKQKKPRAISAVKPSNHKQMLRLRNVKKAGKPNILRSGRKIRDTIDDLYFEGDVDESNNNSKGDDNDGNDIEDEDTYGVNYGSDDYEWPDQNDNGSGDNKRDDYIGSGDNEEDDYGGSGDAEGDDYSGSGDNEEDDYGGSGDNEGDDYDGSGDNEGYDYSGSGDNEEDDYGGSGDNEGDDYGGSGDNEGDDYGGSGDNEVDDYGGSGDNEGDDYGDSGDNEADDYDDTGDNEWDYDHGSGSGDDSDDTDDDDVSGDDTDKDESEDDSDNDEGEDSSEQRRQETDETRAEYAEYILNVSLALAKARGVSVSKEQLSKDIVDLIEFQIEIMEYAFMFENEKRIRLRSLQRRYDALRPKTRNGQINWIKKVQDLFASGGMEITEKEYVTIESFDYIMALRSLLDKTPSRTIVNYIHWNFISRVLKATTKEMRKLHHGWDRREMNDKMRMKDCVEEIQAKYIAGYEYVRRYVPDEILQTASDMVDDIQKEVELEIEKSPWMDAEIRHIILDKLVYMKKVIGYPDSYRNRTIMKEHFKGLSVTKSHYENTLSIMRYMKWENLKILYTNQYPQEVDMNPLIVNAFFSPVENAIEITAADFQKPLYDVNQPWYTNYGIIGLVMSHEVNHGFDNSGRLFDKTGELAEWSPEMLDQYDKRVQCFIDQFTRYSVVENKTGNIAIEDYGEQTAGENIADSMGLNSVFKAYQRRLRECDKPDPMLPGLEDLSNEQLFFLSFANTWCEVVDPEKLPALVKHDPHSVGQLRVIGSVSNSEDFAKAYNCPTDSPMNPKNKCNIWN